VDHAVALVQSYLQLNGYFTVTEVPVVEALKRGGVRSVTDIDIIGFRFPCSKPLIHSAEAGVEPIVLTEPDPLLQIPENKIDVLIVEVKEGKAQMNTSSIDLAVVRAVLSRFGCSDDAEVVLHELGEHGVASTGSGYQLRPVIFGGLPRDTPPFPCAIISLGHVVAFLQDFVRTHWTMLRQIQFKEPAFAFLMTLEKARRGERRTRRVPRSAREDRGDRRTVGAAVTEIDKRPATGTDDE
jgi:hypothetical protein